MSRMLSVAPVRKSVRVAVAPDRAFEVFTACIARWWPRTHSIGRSPMREVVIEPRAGGRWYERGEDGGECDWGKVLAWEPPTRLVLAWQINADFRYDPQIVTEVEVRFVPDGPNATLVELEHRHLERVGERAEELRNTISAPNGWSEILERYAAAAAEST